MATAINSDQRPASVTTSAVAGGVFGATLAAVPTSFERPPLHTASSFKQLLGARAVKVGVIGMVTGAALSAATAGAVTLTGADGVTAGGAIAGVGLLAAQIGRLKPGGFYLRDSGGILRSLGKLGVVGGVTVAGTSALQSSKIDVLDTKLGAGVATGLAGGATTLGALGMIGAMRRPPRADQIARTVLEPAAHSLDGITPDVAKGLVAERDTFARSEFLKLPTSSTALTDDERWAAAGKGKGFLRGVATRDEISAAMGEPAVRQPVRIYTSLKEAADPDERIQLTLDRFKAAMADKGGPFGMVHVISADAAGGTSEMLPLAIEHGRKGDALTIMMQTASKSPEKAFFETDEMSKQYEKLMRGIKEHLDTLDVQDKTKVVTSGLCLGTVPIYKARAHVGGDLSKLGVDHAILPVGPAMERDVRKVIGGIDRGKVDGVHFRSKQAVLDALDRGDETPKMLVHTEDDDPLRIGLHSLLVKFPMRENQYFMPIISAVAHYLDAGLEEPIAGRMLEVGHRVEAAAVADANLGAGLGMTRRQMDAVDQSGIRINAIRGIASQKAS